MMATQAQPAKTVTQLPNLKSMPDATQRLQERIKANEGNLLFSEAGVVRITQPLVFDLAEMGSVAVRGSKGVTLVMDGPGPAIRIVGTHEGTASPQSFQPATWNERMPIISGIEILGNHPQADGIELIRTVGAIIHQTSIRWCRHAIRLVDRNRNVLISDVHLYENEGIGIYLDDVNLHQINVSNSHISYNRQGGIVVRDGNVRNLHVAGCDIEGNMPADETPTKTANVLLDVSGSAQDRSRSIAEIAITGNTIQHAANYSGSEERTVAPGGTNIRITGKPVYPINSVTISGNVLSDTTTNVDIEHAHDITIIGNTFFAPKPANLRVRRSQRVIVNANTFNPRQFDRPGIIVFDESTDCVISDSTLHKFNTPDGALILKQCSGMILSGLQFSDCASGIVLRNTRNTTITGCRITRTAKGAPDLDIDASNRDILLSGNAMEGSVRVDKGVLRGEE